jgi:hypothetical protein
VLLAGHTLLRRPCAASPSNVIAEGREQRLIWRGECEGRFWGSFAPHLGDAVSNLLDRFPKAVHTPIAPQPVAQELP